jgi:phage shock protein A
MSPNDDLTLVALLLVAMVLTAWVIVRHLGTSRQARAALTAGEEYRSLADEYRRLTDLAVTAQEHVDLRLTDLSVRMDELRDQLERMQRILKEVE